MPSGVGIAGYTHIPAARHGRRVPDRRRAGQAGAPAARVANGEFTQFSPGLRQLFFIGNGRITAGTVQRFIVPAGATRLFLGFAEACSTTRLGCFNDNGGAYQVHGEIAFDP